MADDAAALAAAVGRRPVTVGDRAGHTCRGGAHSYLSDGRVVCWVAPLAGARPAAAASQGTPESASSPTTRYAVDAELVDRPPPAYVASRWDASGSSFWQLWCATEVVAKIVDRPIITFVTGSPVTDSPAVHDGWVVHWLAEQVDEVLVVVGAGRRAADQDPAT